MYELTEKLFFVHRAPLFSNLDLRLKTRIADATEGITFQQGDWIFRQGDTGDALYMLIDGEVSILLNGDEINVMRPTDSFGELALLDNGARTAGAMAKTDIHALRLTKQTFDAMIELSPALRLGILREIGRRLRAINERTVELADRAGGRTGETQRGEEAPRPRG